MRFADVLSWRWTPTFALVGGSLVFVLLVTAIVPDHVGDDLGNVTPKASPSGRGGFARALGSANAPGAEPGDVPPPAVTPNSPALQRRLARERRQRAAANPNPSVDDDSAPKTYDTRTHHRPAFGNLPVDRLFNRNAEPEGAPPVEPAPGAAAEEPQAAPAEAAPAEAPPSAPAPT